jgi:hypothetical protein
VHYSRGTNEAPGIGNRLQASQERILQTQENSRTRQWVCAFEHGQQTSIAKLVDVPAKSFSFVEAIGIDEFNQ